MRGSRHSRGRASWSEDVGSLVEEERVEDDAGGHSFNDGDGAW